MREGKGDGDGGHTKNRCIAQKLRQNMNSSELMPRAGNVSTARRHYDVTTTSLRRHYDVTTTSLRSYHQSIINHTSFVKTALTNLLD